MKTLVLKEKITVMYIEYTASKVGGRSSPETF